MLTAATTPLAWSCQRTDRALIGLTPAVSETATCTTGRFGLHSRVHGSSCDVGQGRTVSPAGARRTSRRPETNTRQLNRVGYRAPGLSTPHTPGSHRPVGSVRSSSRCADSPDLDAPGSRAGRPGHRDRRDCLFRRSATSGPHARSRRARTAGADEAHAAHGFHPRVRPDGKLDVRRLHRVVAPRPGRRVEGKACDHALAGARHITQFWCRGRR